MELKRIYVENRLRDKEEKQIFQEEEEKREEQEQEMRKME